MWKSLLLLTLDPHLGRVDISTLSEQTLMEMVVENLSDDTKKAFQDENEMFLDVCKWRIVECDEDGQVVRCQTSCSLGGTIQLSFLPRQIFDLALEMTDLSGTLDTSALPASFMTFSVEDNSLHGTIDFTALPRNVESFNVATNAFTSSAVLDSLPGTIENLYVGNNKFSGTLCLTRLPQGLQRLGVSNNSFTGKFHLENANDNIVVHAMHNAFCASAVIQNQVGFVNLHSSGIDTVLDAHGETHGEIGQKISYCM